jgi:signal transduction histidine kinase
MTHHDCFTPEVPNAPGAALQERTLDAQRSVRYDGLLQLIDEVQRRRSIEDVAQVVASRWKHCALVVAQGNQSTVTALLLDQLETFDALMWNQRIPRHLAGDNLRAARSRLPPELAAPQGMALSVLPVQQGTSTIGILSVLTFEKAFDNLDRKFNALVAGAMATRIVAILTEQSLTSDLMQAQKKIMEQRQAGIMGRLVNGVAHELNTPLGVQIASCDALAALVADTESVQEFSQDIQDIVGLIDQQAHRAAKIVKRLKQISDASVASPRLDTPLREELCLIADAHADLDIQLDCPPTLALSLDRAALATVLSELLDNARTHGGCALGAAPVHIRVAEEATHISLRISDPGNGFDPEQAEHFFDPFFTSKLNRGHIGIGGYIAKNVARDALGARLELQAASDHTSVTLYFSKP